MEVEAVDEGTLGKILVPAGTEGVAVNDVIGLLLEEGEDAVRPPAPRRTPAAAKRRRAPPRAEAATDEPAKAAPTAEPPAPRPRRPPTAAASSRARSPSAWPSRPGSIWRRSPAAVRMAGSSRRISRRRWRRASARRHPPPRSLRQQPTPAAVAGSCPCSGAWRSRTHRTRRSASPTCARSIARRLTEAKQQIPHFYLTVDCELDALLEAAQGPQRRDRAPTTSSRSTT